MRLIFANTNINICPTPHGSQELRTDPPNTLYFQKLWRCKIKGAVKGVDLAYEWTGRVSSPVLAVDFPLPSPALGSK